MSKLTGILLALFLSVSAFADTLSLKAGWNLIGTNSQDSLSIAQSSIGTSNLLVIQGAGVTYQKSYVDQGLSFLNNFTAFEIGKGYWVKLANDAMFSYTKASLSGSIVLSLKAGWNLVDPLQDTSLTDILTQLGNANVLVIQGAGVTYQKAYVDQGLSFLNNFSSFEDGKGYWIKLNNDANLTFSFSDNLNFQAVDNSANLIQKSFSVNGNNVSVKVFTDSNITTTSTGTLSIYGLINSTAITSELQLNGNYSMGTKFQILVYDSFGTLIGSSQVVSYAGMPMNFGTVNIDFSGTIETPPEVPDINTTTTVSTPPPVPTFP